MSNVRTGSLKKVTGGNFRLSNDDREFLADLVKVRMISESDANDTHYAGRKTSASKRLNKLVDEGLLKRTDITVPGQGKIKAYSFADESVARKYGAKLPKISRMRNGYHELIVSRLYFAEGRPESYKIEADFSDADMNRIRRPGESKSEMAIPDAMYLDRSGRPVVVEADSGQYNSTQIKQKISAWSDHKQVWGQPQARKSAVENFSDAVVHRF